MQAVESMVPRRRFLGSAVTLGAGAAIGTTVSFPDARVAAAAGAAQSAVHDELNRQIKAGVRALRGPRAGEAARALASTVRVLAAHCQETGIDASRQRALQKALQREGRDAVLQHDGSAMFDAEARQFGAEKLPREPFNLAARTRALEAMQQRGASAALLDAAGALERLAPQLDRSSFALAVARQSGCPDLTAQLYFLEFVALASCLWNPIACAGFQGAYWGLKVSIYLAGC